MKVFYSFMIACALIACSQVEEESSATKETEQTESKEFITEVITRTYSAKMEQGESVKDTLQQMQSLTKGADGNEIETTFYKLDGSIAWIERYIYGEDGKKIGSDYFDQGINNTIYYAYELDSKGRRTSYQAFDHGSDAVLFEGATRYENFGKLKKDGHLNEKGDFICVFEYVYDDEGKELSHTYIDDMLGKRFTSTYEYMDFNDDREWTKRHVMKNGEVFSIETREFKKIEVE